MSETREAAERSAAPVEQRDTLLEQLIEATREAAVAQQVEQSFLDQLQRIDDGKRIIQHRAEIVETARAAAIRATDPTDWILTRDRQGTETAMVGSPGAAKMAPVLGISAFNVGPVINGELAPVKTTFPDNSYSYRLTFDARCQLFGTTIERMEAERRSDEEFTGRSVDAANKLTNDPKARTQALDADLRASVCALARTKAVRILGGMARVPRAELERAWSGTTKSTEKCRKGHGYGTSESRGAQQASDDGVTSGAAGLWREILGCVGGDIEHAKRVLRECTSAPATKDRAAFAGFDDFARIAKDWQLERAQQKWAKHPMNKPAPGGQREPGEDD